MWQPVRRDRYLVVQTPPDSPLTASNGQASTTQDGQFVWTASPHAPSLLDRIFSAHGSFHIHRRGVSNAVVTRVPTHRNIREYTSPTGNRGLHESLPVFFTRCSLWHADCPLVSTSISASVSEARPTVSGRCIRRSGGWYVHGGHDRSLALPMESSRGFRYWRPSASTGTRRKGSSAPFNGGIVS